MNAARGAKTLIRFLCCSGVLAMLSKFHTSSRTRQKKYIQAYVIQEKRNDRIMTSFCYSKSCDTEGMQWWQLYLVDDNQFFIFSMVIGGPASGIANPKLWGPKVWLQVNNNIFVWEAASQSTKWLNMLKIWGACPPGLFPGYAYGFWTACFLWKFLHTQLFFT